jgi:hypothetical protein
LNPEDITKKAPNEKEGTWNEKDFKSVKTGADLDVPGSELDDQQENVEAKTKKTIITVSAETTIMTDEDKK